MADNNQSYPLPSPRLLGTRRRYEDSKKYKWALILGLTGAGLVLLFFFAHWSIVLVGAVLVLALAGFGNELLLLCVVFLLPVSWSLGPQGSRHDVPTAVHCLLIGGFLLGRFWGGQLRIRGLLSSSIARASLVLFATILLSIVLGKSGWTRSSAHGSYTLASYVGFFFLILVWVDSRERVEKVLTVLLYSTLATAAFAIVQELIGGYSSFWLYLNPQDENMTWWDGRAPSFLNYSNCLAGYLNLVLPFALACLVCGTGKWRKLGGWTLALGVLALLSTQSIGGLLGFAASMTLAVFCFVQRRKRRLVLLAGVFASLCLLYALRSILNPAHSYQVFGIDAVTRLLLWGTAWGYFVHSPILGVGWGNFSTLYGADLSSYDWIEPGILDVNNTYLKFLADTGILGFIAFAYFVIQSWRIAWRQWRSSSAFLDRALAFGVLGALVSVLAHGLVDVLIQVSPQFGTLLWVLLALLVVVSRLPGTPLAPGRGSLPRMTTLNAEVAAR